MNLDPADGGGLTSLSSEAACELDRLCDRFESAWRDGKRPRFEDHLGHADGTFRDVLRNELIAIEVEWRRRLDDDDFESRSAADGHHETVVHRPSAGGVLDTLSPSAGAIHRVLLRDTDGGPEPPIHRPISGGDPGPGTRYRIDGEIARGGMGAILRGRDPDLGRDVALKVLPEDYRDDADMVRRFVEEAPGRLHRKLCTE